MLICSFVVFVISLKTLDLPLISVNESLNDIFDFLADEYEFISFFFISENSFVFFGVFFCGDNKTILFDSFFCDFLDELISSSFNKVLVDFVVAFSFFFSF